MRPEAGKNGEDYKCNKLPRIKLMYGPGGGFRMRRAWKGVLSFVMAFSLISPLATLDNGRQPAVDGGIHLMTGIIGSPSFWEDDFIDSTNIFLLQDTVLIDGAVHITSGKTKGIVASKEIACPEGLRYDFLLLQVSEPENTTIRIAVLNATETSSTPGHVNEPIPGFELRSASEVSLLVVSPLDYPILRLQANLETNGTERPFLLKWTVYFVGIDEWREDFIGKGKIHSLSMANQTKDGIVINQSMKRRYSNEQGEYGKFPALLTNYESASGNNYGRVFYPKPDGTGYQDSVLMGEYSPRGFDFGDLDEDGNLDLVVANYRFDDSNTIESWVMWGDDSESWSTSRVTNLSTVGAHVATVGDFNCDGLLDMAIGCYDSSTSWISVFVNKGNRNIGPLPDIVIPSTYVYGIDAGDLNNDGFDDIVIAEDDNHEATVHFGGPEGPDIHSDIRFSIPRAWDVLVYDLDRDGYLDVVFLDMSLSGVKTPIFLGGLEGPDTIPDFRLIDNVTAFDAGDLNNDGYVDIVMGHRDGANRYFYVYYGSFQGWVDSNLKKILISKGATNIEIADVNMDGYDDIIASVGNDYINIYYSSSYGPDGTEDIQLSIWEPGTIKAAIPPRKVDGSEGSIITESIDKPADKKWDMLYLDYETPEGTDIELTVLDETFRAIEGLRNLPGPDVDLSGFGNARIHLRVRMVSQDEFATPTLKGILVKWMDLNVWREEFYGTAKFERSLGFSALDGHLVTTPGLAPGPQLAFATLRPDTSSMSTSAVYRGLEGADYATLPPFGITNPHGASAIDVADVNGDGYPDVAFAVPRTSDVNSSASSPLYLGGMLGHGPSPYHSFRTVGALDVLLRDLNGDGNVDVVFAQERDGSDYGVPSSLFWGSAAGWKAAPDLEFSTFGASCVEAADLDGDGRLDLVFADYRDVTTATSSCVFLQGADGFCATVASYYLPTNGARAVAVGDLDGDGRADLVFANSLANGLPGTDSYVYWGRAGGGFRTSPTRLPTVGARDVAVADLDGDGDLDVVFANEHDDFLDYRTDSFVYLNDGSGGFGSAPDVRLPTVGAVAVDVADLDGTGRSDIAFACMFDGSSFEVPSMIYLGDASGWPASPSLTLPVAGASDVRAAQLFDRGSGAYVSRQVAPIDPYDTGTFHTLRCQLSLDPGRKVRVGLVDSGTWEVLVEMEAASGPIERDLSGLFRVKDHPSVRVFVAMPRGLSSQTFSADDLWLNWTKRVREAPSIQSLVAERSTVLRTNAVNVTMAVTDEYDLPGELKVRFESKPSASTIWSGAYLYGTSYGNGNWTTVFRPPANAPVGPYDIRVSVADNDLYTSEGVIDQAIVVKNNVPTPPEVRISPGRPTTTDALSVEIIQRASDVESEPISYRYTWSIDGVHQPGVTGAAVDPSVTKKGQNWSVEVRAFDGLNESAPARAWTVVQNAAPFVATRLSLRSLTEDVPDLGSLDLTGAFGDPDGDALSWWVQPEPEHLVVSIDPVTGLVTITPQANWYGNENLTFFASDGEFQADQTVLVTYLPVDDAPTIVAVNGILVDLGQVHLTVEQDKQLVINMTVIDVEGDPLVVQTDSTRLRMDELGNLTFLPTNDDVGVHRFRVKVSEAGHPEMWTEVNITVTVGNVNDPMDEPRIASPAPGQRFGYDQSVWLNGTCLDPDARHGQVLNFTWTSNLTGPLGFGPSLKVVHLGPGAHNITLRVSDGEFTKEAFVEVTVEEEVVPTPPPPIDGEGTIGAVWMMIGIVVALCVAGLAVLIVRARRVVEPLAPQGAIDEEAKAKQELREIADTIQETVDKLEADKKKL